MTAFQLGRILVACGVSALAFGWLGYLKGFSDGQREGELEGRASVYAEQAKTNPVHRFYDREAVE